MGLHGFAGNLYNDGAARRYQRHAPLTSQPCKEGIVATQKCNRCGEEKPLDQFVKNAPQPEGREKCCKACRNTYLRAYNVTYTKSHKGFIMRVYRNMQSRVQGVQWRKAHLYAGKSLLSREQFYEWAFTSAEFHELFAAWEFSGYARQYTPSVDRIDSSRGYELENMEWVTHSENSRRGNQSRIAMGRHIRNCSAAI
jgi:hypothetical protein